MTEDQLKKANDLNAQIEALKKMGIVGANEKLIYHPFPNAAGKEIPGLLNLIDRINEIWIEGIQELIKNRQLQIEKI